jgi:hypothetical protein
LSDQWGYTVEEVAAILKVSKHTILRRAKELGAVQIAGNEGSIKVRRYRVLRFPRTSLEKYLTKLTGNPVMLSSLTLPQTRRAKADWEQIATRKLAEIASANSEGIPDRGIFARIARNAHTLCFVDRGVWKDIVFLELEEDDDYESGQLNSDDYFNAKGEPERTK